jgi:hypothetical protein
MGGSPRVRRVEVDRDRAPNRAVRPIRSFVPTVDGDPVETDPSSVVEDDGLVVAVYDVAGDAQNTDGARNEGGALILDVRVELVFCGGQWSGDIWMSEIVSAVETIFGSPYLLGLAQYGFRTVALRGVTLVTSSDVGLGSYSFDDVGNLIWDLIDEGKFPEPDDAGGRVLYMVFMPPNSTPPSGVRGEHGDPEDSGLFTGADRAWVGYVSYGTFDHITSVFTHQLVEAITNPEPDEPAWVMTRTINGGREIGDACNNTVDRLDSSAVLVQAYWSEQHKACVIPQGLGQLGTLQSLQSNGPVQPGSADPELLVGLDRPTPIQISISLVSDDPDVVVIEDGVLLERGQTSRSIPFYALPFTGPARSVAVHASYAGVTLTAQVEVTPQPSNFEGWVRTTDGEGIPGAVVGIDNAASGGEINVQLLTADNGGFTTPTLPPGTYAVEVTASGYVPVTGQAVLSEGVPATELDCTLVAQLPSTIAGTVTDAGLTPISGAQVLLIQKDQAQRLTTSTDDSGNYSLTVEPVQYTGGYWLRVTATGYTEGFLDFEIPNGTDLAENFTVNKLGLLVGVVTDAHSATPIAAAYIRASVTAPDPLTPTSITTAVDPAGHYQLQLPPGPSDLTAQSGGHEVFTVTLTVEPGTTTQQDFPLVPASATLSCTVSDSQTGNPIGRSHVRVDGALPERPTFDGSHTVEAIPNGQHQVDISAQGYESLQISLDFTAGQTFSTDFTLDPAGSGPNPHRTLSG